MFSDKTTTLQYTRETIFPKLEMGEVLLSRRLHTELRNIELYCNSPDSLEKRRFLWPFPSLNRADVQFPWKPHHPWCVLNSSTKHVDLSVLLNSCIDYVFGVPPVSTSLQRNSICYEILIPCYLEELKNRQILSEFLWL